MRQRAAAGPTPPRSGDSDAGNWQLNNNNSNRMNQPRQRHHKSSGSRDNYEMLQEPRSVSMRDVHMDGDNGGDVGVLTGAIDTATTMEGPTARRRRTSGHPTGGAGLGGVAGGSHHQHQQHHNYPKDETHRLRHSPQHYLDEYNKNYNTDVHSPTTTTTAGPSATAPHSATGRYMTTTASEIYYAQYDSHHSHKHLHHHYDSTRPPGGVIMHRSSSTPNAHKLSFQHFESSFHLDPNPLAAVHFRKALHVPDKKYREFLHGKGRDTTPVFHPICCANVCAGFSFVGFIFMMLIGILLDTQPLFIGGTLPSALKENDSGKTSTIYFVTAERLPAATHAYQTSYAYIVTMLACLIYAYYERLNSMVKRRSYQDVPDATSPVVSTVGIVGAGSGDGGVGAGGVLPDYHHDGGGEKQAYQMSTWNRLVGATNIKLREWAATATSRVWNGRANYKKRSTRKKTCAKTI